MNEIRKWIAVAAGCHLPVHLRVATVVFYPPFVVLYQYAGRVIFIP